MNPKGKNKVNVATVDNPMQQMQFVPQTDQNLVQDKLSTLPQTTNGQGSTTPQKQEEVVEVAIEVEVAEEEVEVD